MLTRYRSALSLHAMDSSSTSADLDIPAGPSPSKDSAHTSPTSSVRSDSCPASPSTPSSSLIPLRRSSSSNISLDCDTPKKAVKTASVRAHAKHKPSRDKKIEELKRKALDIPSQGKTSVNSQQLAVLATVYYEITPYPDAVWIAMLALTLDRNYHTVQVWFNNQRQHVKAENRENPDYDLPKMVGQFVGPDGRPLKLRPSALEMAKEEEWTDDLFYGIIMLYNLKPRAPLQIKGRV